MHHRPIWLVALVLPGLVACAHITPEAAFQGVETLVSERGAPAPRWSPDAAAVDDAVHARISELLGSELTVEAAVEIAILNNRSLRAAFEDLEIARAEVVQAARLANPVLAGGPRFSDRSGTQLELGIVHNLLQLLARPARQRLASAQLEEVRLRLADETLGLAAETQTACLELVAAGQIREMRRLVVAASEGASELARRMVEAGNLSELQLANEDVQLAEARSRLVRAEMEEAEAREQLTRLLGLSDSAGTLTLAAGLPALPGEEPSADDLEATALTQRLDLAAAEQAVDVAALALGITRDWRYLASAEIGVAAERETDGEWLVGPELAIELPIFDQHQAALATEAARLRQRAASFAALAVEVRSEVRTLRDRVLAMRRLVEHQRDVVLPLRERIVALTEAEHNYMLVGAFDLLLAKQQEHDAYRDYLEALRDYWISRVALQRAVGGSLSLPAASPATPSPPPAPSEHHHSHQHDAHSHEHGKTP